MDFNFYVWVMWRCVGRFLFFVTIKGFVIQTKKVGRSGSKLVGVHIKVASGFNWMFACASCKGIGLMMQGAPEMNYPSIMQQGQLS